MKILLINKFHYRRGGSETYYFAQAEALRAKGHEVIFFAMQDENNLPCEQESYFVPNVDYNKKQNIVTRVAAGIRLFYSFKAKENMERLIEAEHPDVAHIGLLHRQITFSVVDVLKKHDIPVVMTMHDLIFACPNYTMLAEGKICEDCLEHNLSGCIRKKCVKGSVSKSILAVCEAKFLNTGKYYDKIDLYIAECMYYKMLMEKSGFTQSPVIHMTNFLPVRQEYHFNEGYSDYILYFGRFSREKGIHTLLKAHHHMNCKYKLRLVGAGPDQNELEEYVKKNVLSNVEFLGAIYGDEMEEIIEMAKVIVVPSEWYENCPYALLQAIAKGKIVIASRIGGLPELIEDGKTGYLFEAGNAVELADRIETVMAMDQRCYENMSRLILKSAKEKHNWEAYTNRLIMEYNALIQNVKKKGQVKELCRKKN